MSRVDIAELRRLLADDAPIRWAQNAAAVWNALPALLDELEAAQEEVRRLTQANGDLRKERDRAVKEAQRQDSVAKGLRAELAAAQDLLARIHRDGGHHTEAVGFAQSVADADLKVSEWLLAAEERTALAAHDAALLRRLAAESAPGERADIAPWLLAEADRIEKEAANGKTGS